MALNAEGRVFYFNKNRVNSSHWTEIPDLPGKVVQIVSQLESVYLLMEDGSVYRTYALGPEFDIFLDEPRTKKLAATHYELALLHVDGTVSVLKSNLSPNVPAAMMIPNEYNANIVDIAAGQEHFLALTGDGKVLSWGEDYDNRIRVPAAALGAVKIAAGAEHSLALMPNGTVIAWGSNFWNQCDVPVDLLDVVDIYAGGTHSAAVTRHGQIVLWGSNSENETGALSTGGGIVVDMALCTGGTAMIYDFPTPGAPAPIPPRRT